MIDASDDILHRMCTEKLDGEAKRCFEDETSSDLSSKSYEQLKESQRHNEKTRDMITNIDQFEDYFIQDNMLMKRRSPSVPFAPRGRIRSNIIKIYHDTPANGTHFDRDKTIKKVQQRHFWSNIISDIRNHIKSCISCLQNNHVRRKPPSVLKPITPTTRQENKYIISLTDVLSKFIITKAVRDCMATTAARFLTKEVILKYGTPKCVLTDNGTHFIAAMMSELFKRIDVTHLYSTPYHPITDG